MPSSGASGWHRHYKGGLYEVLHEATLESDLGAMIVYRAADGSIWVRPRAVFFEMIDIDGRTVQRFAPVSDPAIPPREGQS
jgi:hypothetical protein